MSKVWDTIRATLDFPCDWADAVTEDSPLTLEDLILMELAALQQSHIRIEAMVAEDAIQRSISVALQQRKQLMRLVQAAGARPASRTPVPLGPGLSMDDLDKWLGDLGDEVVATGGGRGRRKSPVD